VHSRLTRNGPLIHAGCAWESGPDLAGRGCPQNPLHLLRLRAISIPGSKTQVARSLVNSADRLAGRSQRPQPAGTL